MLQWFSLSPHSKKVPQCQELFHVKFAFSTPACVGSLLVLQLPPIVPKSWGVNGCAFLYINPAMKLAICPGCTMDSSQLMAVFKIYWKCCFINSQNLSDDWHVYFDPDWDIPKRGPNKMFFSDDNSANTADPLRSVFISMCCDLWLYF